MIQGISKIQGIYSLSKASYFHIRALRHIRSSFITEACKTIAAAIVVSRLYYCNSLLAGASFQTCMARLQLVQYTLARVVTEKSRFCRITPVQICIGFLFATEYISKLLYYHIQGLHFQQPSYILLPSFHGMCRSTRPLRSSSLLICIPTRKTAMAKSKSVSSVSSYIWNKLPYHLSSISTLPAFRNFQGPFNYYVTL